jgi:hypothetical protein
MIDYFFEHPYTRCYLRSGMAGPHFDAFAVTLAEQAACWGNNSEGAAFNWVRQAALMKAILSPLEFAVVPKSSSWSSQLETLPDSAS